MKWFERTFWDKMKKGKEEPVRPYSRGPKRFDAYLFIFLFFFAGILLVHSGIVQSTPSNFTQSDWSGGMPIDNATCTSTGGSWSGTECLATTPSYSGYNAIDSGIIAGTDLQLGASDYSVTLTSDNGAADTCTAGGSCLLGGGFNAGTLTGTVVSGTGAAADIELSKVVLVDSFGTQGTVQRNPSNGADALTDMVVEGGYIYLAGYHSFNGNKDWLIEKRRMDTGAPDNAFDGDGSITIQTGTNDDFVQAIAVDSTHIYVAGDDETPGPGDIQWRVEKWNKTTGVWETSFSGGAFIRNMTTAEDYLSDIAVDGNDLYLAGYEPSPGSYQWHIKKLDKNTGTEVGAFGGGTGFVVSNSPSPTDQDVLKAIAIDGDDMYLVGYSGPLQPGSDEKWRFEKRNKITGQLVDTFDGNSSDTGYPGNGAVVNNPSSWNDELVAIAVAGSHIYLAGHDASLGNTNKRWRVEKRRKDTGALDNTFGANGVLLENPGPGIDILNDITVDSANGHIYLAGYEYVASPKDYRMRIEKRDMNTGAPVTDFDEDGVYTNNPSADIDMFVKVALDATYLIAGGYDTAPTGFTNDYQIHVEKLSKSGSAYAAAGAFESAVIDLGKSNYMLGGISANIDVTASPNIIAGAGREISSTDSGLIALWHINSSDSSAKQIIDSAGGYTGNLVSGGGGNTTNMWSAGGKLGMTAYNALKFDGVDDHVAVGSIAGPGIRSISFWINPDVDTVGVLQLGPSRYVRVSGGNITTPGLSTQAVYVDGVLGPAVVTTGAWHHVVVVTGGNESGGPVYLGRGNMYFMDGRLDEVAFYDRVLTAYEVKKLYDGPAATFQIAAANSTGDPWSFVGPPNGMTADSFFAWEPAGLWHLNSAPGGQVTDASGRGHDGTLTGGLALDTTGQKLGTGALLFDGTDDYVDIGNIEADIRSIEFWINHNDPAAGSGILELGSGISISVAASTGNVVANGFGSPAIYVDGVQGQTTLTNGVWRHVVVTANTGVPASGVKFGVSNTNYLGGKLDEIVMYDRALTPGEVAVRYNAGSGREGAAVGNLATATILSNKQYIRYRAYLHTGDTAFTPSIQDVSIGFSGASTGAAVTSSVFNSATAANFLTTISWTQQLNNQAVRLQVASSPDNGTWNYCGKDNCQMGSWPNFTDPGNYYFETGTPIQHTLHAQLRDAVDDQYFQYRVWMGSLTGTGIPIVNDISIGYDTAHLEVLAPDESSTTYAPNVDQLFNVVLKAKDSSQAVIAEHTGVKTVQLTASVAQPDTSCPSSFNGGTTYTTAASFVAGKATIPVRLCDTGVPSFTIHAQETAGGGLNSTDGGGFPLTISAVNPLGSVLTGESVSLSTDIAGQTATATINFTTTTALAAGSKVKVTFDGDFNISGAAYNLGNTIAATVNTPSSNILTITLNEIVGSSQAVSLLVDGIDNPLVPQTTSDYDIVTTTSADTTVDAGTATGSTITAAFSFTAPGPTESWAVNEKKTVTWITSGTVNNVKVEYSVNGGNYAPIKDSEGAPDDGIISNDGTFAWNIEDLVEPVINNPQVTQSVSVTLRVSDADTGHPPASGLSNDVEVKYHKITWIVRDLKNNPVLGLNVNEPATTIPNKAVWTVSGGSYSGVAAVRYYPHNADANTDEAYSTTFTEDGTNYAVTAGWRAVGDEVKTIMMSTAATASTDFKVNIEAHYVASTDAINIVAWLTQSGNLVTKDPQQTASLEWIMVDIYDGANTRLNATDLGSGVTGDANGMFSGITYDPQEGLNPNGKYRIKAVISHFGGTYTGITASVVPTKDTTGARIMTVYDKTADAVTSSVWLERGGITVAAPGGVTLDVLSADGATVLQSFVTANATLANGVYSGITWAPNGGISADDIYMIKATITYSGKTYETMEPFSKGELGAIAASIISAQTGIAGQTTALLGSIASQAATIQGDLAAQTTSIKAKIAGDVGGITSAVDSVKAETSPRLANVKKDAEDAANALKAADPSAVSAKVAEEMAKGVQAEIVTRVTTVTTGATVPVRFRTATGLLPRITVYDPGNALLVNYASMTEVSTTGIYEYKLLLDTAWGLGDFTVVVTEPAKQTVDSLILHVTAVPPDTKKAGATSAITTDTVYSRLNNVNANIDTLLSSVDTVNGNTADIDRDVDTLLKRSGRGGDGVGGVDAMKEYIDEVVNALGAEGDDSPYKTILGKLANTESTLAAIGQDAAIAVAINQRARRQAFMIAHLATMVRKKLEAGEIEGAEEDMTALNETLAEFQETVRDVPQQVTSDGIASSVGAAVEDLKRITEGKGLADIVPVVEEGLTKGGKAGPKEMLEMRNDVNELKSLMVEIRSLLDREVNQPIVHGWLEGDE